MQLPPSFRRFLRKVARYVGPVGATTVLRGCPCPAAVDMPDKPYTASIPIDSTTLDATPESWAGWCPPICGEMVTACFVHVATSEGNSQPIATACSEFSGTSSIIPSSDSAVWVSTCKNACGDEQDCTIGPDPLQDNKPIIRCESWWTNCAGGRGTEGIAAERVTGSDHAALALAEMAALEAQSVPAFQRLARELGALGAPRALRRRASRSGRDERRHARTMASLARRRGANLSATNFADKPLPLRSLEDVAMENAVEGCVRETYGAWLAFRQSQNAADPELRATMQRIAMDEARHAQLAWDVHRWAMRRLDRTAQDEIARRMEAAWRAIVASLPDPNDPAARELGLVQRT